jgi:Ribonuclease G/E
MIVIDVNTGKFIGKGGNLEETVTKNNLEAAEEIARQLRLRDLGGIIVIDFIDMVLESNREAVLRRLIECLGRDRTKHQVAEVTSLGLVQMTRKRVGQGLIEAFSTTCDACSGRGIHIHMDPVKIKAPTPQVNSQTAHHPDVEEESATEHEFREVLNDETPAESESGAESAPKGRRRRRAASSGIITPGA